MADNLGYTPGAGAEVATDEIGGKHYQRVKLTVGVDGAAVDVSATDPMPVTGTLAVTGALTDAQLRASAVSVVSLDPSTGTSFGPITTSSTVLFAAVDTTGERSIVLQITGLWDGSINLQASQDGTTWFDAMGVCQTNETAPTATLYAPGVIVIPATARYFRAITSLDFSGTISGLYSQRAFDVAPFFQRSVLTDVATDVRMPIAGLDPLGNLKQIALTEAGQVLPADGRVLTGSLSRIGTIWQVETTGYNSISVQLFAQVAISATITFQTSNDSTTWTAVQGWPVAGGTAPVTSATAAGHWIFPTLGRYFRVQVTAYTSGVIGAVGVLKSAPAFYPASSPSVTVSSGTVTATVSGTATVTPVTVGTTINTTVTRPADVLVYAANDAWADSTTVPTTGGFTLTSMGRASGGSGIISDIVITSTNDPATLLQGEIWLFDTAVTAINDNAAFAMSDADVVNLVGVVPFTLLSSQAGSGTNSYVVISNLNIGYTCIGSANLRFLIKVKNAYTPASAEALKVRVKTTYTT